MANGRTLAIRWSGGPCPVAWALSRPSRVYGTHEQHARCWRAFSILAAGGSQEALACDLGASAVPALALPRPAATCDMAAAQQGCCGQEVPERAARELVPLRTGGAGACGTGAAAPAPSGIVAAAAPTLFGELEQGAAAVLPPFREVEHEAAAMASLGISVHKAAAIPAPCGSWSTASPPTCPWCTRPPPSRPISGT